MAQVKSDVDVLNDSNWEGSVVAMLAAYAMEHGQHSQYLVVHGVPANVVMAGLTLLIQRVWVYFRAGRQIAETRLQTRMNQMLEDAKSKAGAPTGPPRSYP